jgi:predicted Zn-dependent protease
MSKDLRRLLEDACPSGAEWASLRKVNSSVRSYLAKDGAFESAALREETGYMAEVLVDGQFGYAALASPDERALADAFARALALARSARGRAVFRFGTEVRPATILRYESPRERRAAYGADYIAGSLVAITKAMRISDAIVQSCADVETRDLETEYVSTSGASIEQLTHLVIYSCHALARDGSVIQKRSLNGPRARVAQGGSELLDFERIKAESRIAAEQAIELLSAPDCPSTRTDLVLAPDQMLLQIHESVGHPIEIDRILGDERNFAGSTFVKLEDIGTLRYGSELMNVTFDPSVAGEAASYGADDIGAPARKEFLIKDGILVRALGSLESQARSGKPGVADQRSTGWRRAPIDRMANLNVEPGADKLEDIIASIERGVWMEANRSWSIDDYRNKFQFGCEYGRLIEAGKLGRVVRNPNYRGISSSFWRSLFKVGDASTFAAFASPVCGKGEPNQTVTTGHASPVCAFRDVEIFGGKS